MAGVSLSSIQQQLNDAELSALPALSLAVLRNVTVESMEPYLRFLAYREGFNADVRFGDFDNVVQEALGAGEGPITADTDAVLVFLQFDTLSPDLSRRFASLSDADVDQELERVRGVVRMVLDGLRGRTAATILWHGFETPLHPALGVLDANRRPSQTAVVAELNRFVQEELAGLRNAYFVDLDRCLARVGGDAFYDQRFWHLGRAPYGRRAAEEIAAEDFKILRAVKGRTRKCLVLDCDNVLWGGVVGEDGIAGIRLGETHPGSPYHEFQQAVLELYHRGVILALNSKNDEAAVWEVFERHPGMVLRREHIAAWRINWQDKVANLKELAAELNIGLNAMVFADDSEFEVELVRSMLPEVHVLHLPAAAAVEHRDRLRALGLFDTLTLSDEDRRRGAMYRAEGERRRLQAEVTDLESYYRSLDMQLAIRRAEAMTVPRIAQLTQKTNQFNLTTRRYTEEDIQRFADREDMDVISLRLIDRFGDSGLVGVCILRYEGADALFDTFLLSCRVLGRRVEDAFLARVLQHAAARGAARAVGRYAKTAKNGMAADFYPQRGFARGEAVDDVEHYLYDLRAGIPAPPALFAKIDSDLSAEPALQHEDE